jgi:hypothetical protein
MPGTPTNKDAYEHQYKRCYAHARNVARVGKKDAPRRGATTEVAGKQRLVNVRFSNRPFEVKHFQAIHHCSVDVAHGLALLFGLGT